MTQPYRVIYDGTSHCPLQKMIFGPESTATAPPAERERGIRERVRAVKWDGYLGSADIGKLAGITTEQANSCVSNLVKLGEMAREHRYLTARKAGGQRYAWTTLPVIDERESHRGERTGTFDRVRRALSTTDRAWSAKELAAETRLRRQQVAVALHASYQQGLTTKIGSHPVRYRWKQR